MRRPMTALAACVMVLGIGAPSSSADPVDACKTRATWQVEFFTIPAYADRVLDAVPAGCEEVPARLRVDLLGLRTVGLGSDAFASRAISLDGSYVGTIQGVDPGLLSATLSTVSLSRFATSEAHTPAGSCGQACYRTQVRLITGG